MIAFLKRCMILLRLYLSHCPTRKICFIFLTRAGLVKLCYHTHFESVTLSIGDVYNKERMLRRFLTRRRYHQQNSVAYGLYDMEHIGKMQSDFPEVPFDARNTLLLRKYS